MESLYGDKMRLWFSDTDSFLYYIETEDVSDQNKKVLGKFKDETNDTPIREFVGLRSKMYSFTLLVGEKHTAKGIKKCTLIYRKEEECNRPNQLIKHEMYKNCLFNNDIHMCEMNIISSSKSTPKKRR